MTELTELTPLEGTTFDALLELVNKVELSEGANVLLQAVLTGEKPKPEGRGFYVFHISDSPSGNYRWEYLYHADVKGGKRSRRKVARVRDAAAELAEAAGPGAPNGQLLDLQALSAALKPVPKRRVTRRSPEEYRALIVSAVAEFWEKNNYAPSVVDIAEARDMQRATVGRYKDLLVSEGVLLYDGPRTLRIADGNQGDVQQKGRRPARRSV